MIVLDAHAAVTPDGKPVAVPIPVAPVVVCVIAVNAVLIHNVGVVDGAETVLVGLTVNDVLAVLVPPHPPVTVYTILHVPPATAVTKPEDAFTVATDVLSLLHAPVPPPNTVPDTL